MSRQALPKTSLRALSATQSASTASLSQSGNGCAGSRGTGHPVQPSDTIATALAEAIKRGEEREYGKIANKPAALKG
jgi:hypothetical protein